MLRIKKLEVSDFMNIAHAKFDFNQINYIYGKPASGKSAIFEAIRICLSEDKRASTYGLYVSQGKPSSSIHLECDIEGKPAIFDVTLNRVIGTPWECVMTYGGQVYKNTGVKNFLKSKDIDYFLKIMFSLQHEKDIIEQTPSSRLIYMQKLFNFDFSEQKQEITKSISENKDSLLKLSGKLQATEQSKVYFSSKEEEKERTLTDEKVASIKERLAELEKLSGDSSSVMESLTAKRDALKHLESENMRLEYNIKSFGERLNAIEISKKEKLELQSKIIEYEKLVEDITKSNAGLSAEIEDLEVVLEKRQTELKSAEVKVASLSTEMKHLKEKVTLIEKGNCPTCGQKTDKLDDTAVSKLENVKNEVAELAKSITNARAEIDIVQGNLNDKKDAFSAGGRDLLKYQTLIKTSQASVDKLKYDVSAIKEITDNIAQMKEEHAENAKKIADTQDAITALLEQLNKYQLYSEEIEKLKKTLNEDEKIVFVNSEIRKRNTEKDEKLSEIENEIATTNSSITDTQKTKEAYEDAFIILNKTLPQYESKMFCDMIEKEINNFIVGIFPSYYVKMETGQRGCNLFYTKDRTVTDDKKNKWLDVQMSSGFERAVLNLAFKTVLAKMYGIELFIGDEIDKAANDNDTITLMECLLDVETYKQIFLISHKKSLYEYFTKNYDKDELSVFKADSGQFVQRY